MIILGTAEPYLAGPREIRHTNVRFHKLMEGVTSEQPNVIITVPSASVLVAIGKPVDRVGYVSIYYECAAGAAKDTDVELNAATDSQIEPGFRLLGHLWESSQLIAIYAKVVGQ